MMELRQTGIKVKLDNGNAFAILGRVKEALRRGHESKEFIDEFIKKATSGDYTNLLATVMDVVDVEL